jgi:peptidoglycan biosynthesis protein MviN/MurJ (putative lipid II flippase)
VFFRAFPAVRRPWRVVAVGTLNGAANIVTTLGLLRAGAGVIALPIGYGVGMTVACIVGAVGLSSVVGAALWRDLARYGLRIGLLTALAAAGLLGAGPLTRSLAIGFSPWLQALTHFGIGAAVFGAVYAGLALATREPQAARLWHGLARRWGHWQEGAAGD